MFLSIGAISIISIAAAIFLSIKLWRLSKDVRIIALITALGIMALFLVRIHVKALTDPTFIDDAAVFAVPEFLMAAAISIATFLLYVTYIQRFHADRQLRIFSNAMDDSSVGLVITDAAKAKNPIIYVNKAFETITGFSGAEAIGRNCKFLQKSDRDQEGIRDLRKAIEEKRDCRVLVRNYRKDGTQFWNELTISPIFNSQGDITNFIGVQRDVTERIEAESIANMSHKALTAVTKAQQMLTTDGVSQAMAFYLDQVLDMTQSSIGFIAEQRQANGESMIHFFAVQGSPTPPPAISVSLSQIIPLLGTTIQDDRVSYFNQHPPQIDLFPPLQSFASIPVHFLKTQIGVIGLANRTLGYDAPILERIHPLLEGAGNLIQAIRHERERESLRLAVTAHERRHHSLYEAWVDAVISVDEQGRILSVNPAVGRLFGYTNEELIGADISMMVQQSDPDRNGSHLMRHLKTGDPQVFGRSRQIMGQHKDKRPIPLEIHVIEWREDDQRRFTAFCRDLSSRHVAENALNRYRRLHRLGELTDGLAHDFNNQMAMLIANLERLSRQNDLAASSSQLLTETLNIAKHSSGLSRNILDLTHQESDELTDQQANQIIEFLTPIIRRTLPDDVTLTLQLEKNLWCTPLPQGRLEDALLNLIHNARDAVGEKGVIRIESHNETLKEDVEIHREFVRIDVVDNGVGIPATIIDRVFEPLFTTKKHGEGAGLGLSLVKDFVKRVGGRVRIKAEPKGGTRVILRLPKAARPLEQIVDKGRILVVDDEATITRNIQEDLESAGYDVVTATTVEEALAVLRDYRDIALMLSDVIMPSMNGYDLARHAKSLNPHLEILMMSGFIKKQDGMPMLHKPFSSDDLRKQVSERMHNRLQELSPPSETPN